MASAGEFTELRATVQDLANRPDWPAILALEPRLRLDTGYWTNLWAPLLAVAARHSGVPGARGYLDEAVAGGFSQPELLEGELERLFGTDEDWPSVAAAMRANTPPPALELLDWPELTPAHPVRLASIAPDRSAALLDLLPPARASAWATARELLLWATTRWDHAGTSHVDIPDAVHVLGRAAAGERFACREYTIVLSQALNARGIPARSVSLMTSSHHAGYGRAHAVSEAWIDDLQAWVLLDGQNGMYWTSADGSPLGLAELRRRQRAGERPPAVVSLAGKGSAGSVELWWPYFQTVAPTGVMLSPPPYSPILEGTLVPAAEELRRDPAGTHPDLSEVGIGIVDRNGTPAIQPVSRHPYLRGFDIALAGRSWRLAASGDAWPLPTDVAGEHTATVAAVTDFGALRAYPLIFKVLTPADR